MEKLIYALWRDPKEIRAAFNARLLQSIAPKLAAQVRALRINVQDDAVSGGNSPRFLVTDPQMEATVQLWLDTAYEGFRGPVDALISEAASRWEAWLVSESMPLPNTAHPSKPGSRTEGFSQIVYLRRPKWLEHGQWRDVWQGLHTPVATDTQSTFEYVQNLVIRSLTADSGDYAAIVEECFPMAALGDEAIYYDGIGNPSRRDANKQAMADSCARFIGENGVDCFPTSQFDIKSGYSA